MDTAFIIGFWAMTVCIMVNTVYIIGTILQDAHEEAKRRAVWKRYRKDPGSLSEEQREK